MAVDSKIRHLISTYGHIKIDRMMKEATIIGKAAYYQKTKQLGQNGDFTTAPEISQLFGESIGLWLTDMWLKLGSPPKLLLVELGPGMGSLMRDCLRTAKLTPELYQALQVRMIEINPYLKKQQQQILSNLAPPDGISWHKTIARLPQIATIFIANEFFDAQPIKQYRLVKDRWHEITLICDPVDSQLKFSSCEPADDLQEFLLWQHPQAKDGAIFEESITSLKIIRQITKHIQDNSGAGLFIDYGYNIAPAMRTSRQYNPTLQAIYQHKYAPVISSLGEADLSAHVDFFALANAMREKGLSDDQINVSTQRQTLLKYGIIQRLVSLEARLNPKEYQLISGQVQQLVSNRHMGDLFKTMEFLQTKPTRR